MLCAEATPLIHNGSANTETMTRREKLKVDDLKRILNWNFQFYV